MHLMHVEGLMAHNVYTEEGRFVHRRVDAEDEALPPAGGEDPPPVIRSPSAWAATAWA
jgi:hypothetical protein